MKFVDLGEQYRRYKKELWTEMEKVLDSSQFIMGPAVGELEGALAQYVGVKHAVACASGTDALLLGLLALGVKPGDEVLVPDFTFFATAEVVGFLGAVPVFVDVVEETFNLDVGRIEPLITPRTRGIIPVSLFGQCADMDEISAIARARDLWVMEDAAQSFGAMYKGRRSGALSEVSATSFFPAKPLGCYGDGGALFTNDHGLAGLARQLLNHGQTARYQHSHFGINGRLDALQAAILKVKLAHFDEEARARERAAAAYTAGLSKYVRTPTILPHNRSVWAQYTVRSPRRDAIIAHLSSKGIPTAIHYPIPLHRQGVFSSMALSDRDYAVSTRASTEVFSLPMHPYLGTNEIEAICAEVARAVA